jgi:hypothetical protein
MTDTKKPKTEETKELVKKEKFELTVPEDCFGATDDIDASDITIGRIAIMQGLSDLVKMGKARPGAIINLLDGKELGFKDEKAVEFIPVKSQKYWIEKNADNDSFIGRKPALSANELPWEESVDGVNIKRMYHHSFFVLLPSEIKNLEAMPLEISFRSTDLQAAKKLSALLLKLRKRQEASWNRVFTLTTMLKQKDKHSWFGSMVEVGRETTKQERVEAYNWYKIISDTNTKVTYQEEERPAGAEILSDTSEY